MPSLLLDREGIIRWQNRASFDLSGDATGSSFAALVAPEETDEAHNLLMRILCHGEPAELTLNIRLPTGGFEPREISAAPVRDDGSVVGIFGLGSAAGKKQRPRSRRQEPDPRLTERQTEILRGLAEGKSTRQIADELSISSTTVRNHIANLMAILGVHTRLQAVVAASKAGLIDLDAGG